MKKYIQNAFFYVICSLFILGGVACTEQGKPIFKAREAAGGKYYGGIYRVNETGNPRTLDPAGINDATSSHIAEQIYDKLLSFSPELELVPDIATSWEVSEDGLIYRYTIRRDAVFHDNECFPDGKGRRLTAHDVEFSFRRICDFRARTLAYDYFKGKVKGADEYYEATRRAAPNEMPSVERVEGFRAVNDTLFEVELLYPFAPFENYVALSACNIYPPEAVAHYGSAFSKSPVGTGPFIFEYWSEDRNLSVRRNPNYWRTDSSGNRLPYLDGILFSFIKDDKTQLLEFTAGNLEESYRIPGEFFGDIVKNRQPQGKYSRFQLSTVPSLSTQYYGMMTQSAVFADVRVRQAFSYAVDRERIIRYVLRGQAAAPAHNGIVPPIMPGYGAAVRGYTFNPDSARALMAAAGYPAGKGFPEVTLQLNSGGGRNAQIAEAIQAMLMENLGITVRLRQVEFAVHLDEIDAGRAAFYRLGWIADYPDPENFLNLLYGKLVPATLDDVSPINSVRYANSDFDALYEKALTTTDREERFALYAQAEQIAVNDAPMLFIFYDEDYRFLQPYVRDFPTNPMDRRPYKYVWFDPAKMQ